MARRRRRKEDLRTSILLPADLARALNQAEAKTGWSHHAAVAFYVRAGLELVHGEAEAEPLRRILFTACDSFRLETTAQELTRKARAQLRAARKDAAERVMTPVDLPMPPVEPRKRGRPRKDAKPGLLAGELGVKGPDPSAT